MFFVITLQINATLHVCKVSISKMTVCMTSTLCLFQTILSKGHLCLYIYSACAHSLYSNVKVILLCEVLSILQLNIPMRTPTLLSQGSGTSQIEFMHVCYYAVVPCSGVCVH
jgi:hypothetical protein